MTPYRIITIVVMSLFNFYHVKKAFAAQDVIMIETGIVYSSPFSAVRDAASNYGFQSGEVIDVTLGTLQGQNKSVQGAFSATYMYAQNKNGFGVGTEYRYAGTNEEHFINRIGLGLGTDIVQAGINLSFNATNWSMGHGLSMRFGKPEGISVAILTSDISSVTTALTLGIGYLKKNVMQMEVDVPINTDILLSNPKLEAFSFGFSISVLNIPSTILNVGINGVTFSTQGGGYGTTHAAVSYEFSKSFCLVASLNKRYVFSVAMEGQLN